jgi:PAS domain S-box-containing protein
MDGRQRRQRRPDARHAVNRTVEDSGHLSETAPEIFRALEERFGWEVGVLWMVEGDALRCGGIWRAAGRTPNIFEETCRGSVFRRGAGLPGRVWQREEVCWVEDVLEDEGYLRGEASAEGLLCALALPIQDGGRFVGVFEVLKGEASSAEDLLRVAFLFGNQIGGFVERRRAEDDRDRVLARETEARQRIGGILESINDAFFAVDGAWRFTYVNRRAEEFWDRPRGDLVGKNVWEEFPWAVGTDAHRAILQVAQTGETLGFEAFAPFINSWISGRAYPSSDGVSVYFQDVTEREQLRRKAEEDQARLEGVLQQMPGGVFIADRSGRIFLANGGASRIYGREIRTVEESGRYSLSYPDREPIPEEYYPLARALAGGTISLESCVERPDGTFRVISSNAAPVLDAGGRVVAAVNVFQDVTELREARRVIEERERRYRTLTSNIPGAVFRCVLRDGRPIMEFVSGRIEEITGRPAHDFVADRALSYADVIHPEDRPKNEREVRRALEEHATYNIEYRLLHADGGVRWVNERGSSIFSKGGELLWVDGAIFDITERKRAEEALRRSAGRAAFRAELTEALRPLADPAEIKAEASRVLGQHLGANRVIYGEISLDDWTYVGGSEYLDGAGSIAGRLDLDDYDPSLLENFRAGRTVVAPDLSNEATLTAERLAAFEAAQVRAHVSVPLVKDGRLVAALGVNQTSPRAWTAEEIALVEETAERTWAAVERARAEEALRRSEERYRTLFEKIDEGFCIIDVVFDRADRPTDYRFVETNPAFERMTGLEGAEGRTARELVPDLEEWWFETYGRVALTGEAVHFENHSEAMGRWFEVRASRIGGQESRKVALVFDDTTERKRAAEERDRLLAREWVAVAEEAERERISRELHDRVAHSMGVAHQSLELHDVLAGEDAERAEAKLDLAREMIKASLESTRNLSAELRRLDAEDGLEAELRHLLDVSVPPGIRADIRVEGDEAGVPGHVRGQLFLMLREAVRNAVSHSGCGSLSVGLDIAPERVVGSVEDDGQGFDAAGSGGVGLRSMRERAALLDGDLKLDCEPGRGTRVELSVPLTGGR